MKINPIQIDTYSQNTTGNVVSNGYSILVDGEKYTVGNQQTISTPKDASFSGHTANMAAKKGYAVLINGEKYVVGASKNMMAKTGNAKKAVFDIFKKLMPAQKTNNNLNIIA